MQRGPSDCLRACLASIFEVPWEDAPATETPEDDDRNVSQHNPGTGAGSGAKARSRRSSRASPACAGGRS